MDVSLSKVQIDIAKEARRFLDKECPTDYARQMFEDERGFTDDIWIKMTEMDWMRVRIPEPHGGMGMDQMDLTMVLEEMGRAVLPGPFFSTVLLAAEAIMEAGTDSQKKRYLPGIANGEIRGTLALHESDGGADLGYIQMQASVDGDGFVLNGTKLFVPDAHVADFLVCAARTEAGNDSTQGITLFLVDLSADGISVSPLPTMDGTRKLCAVDFREVRMSSQGVMGELHRGWGPLSRALQRAQVGLCAECVGGAQRAMEIATEYAKIRIQFDQPIGAFQAIKHRCAQMYVEVESARSILYWAAWAQDYGSPEEAALAASVAKAYCSEAYTHVATGAIQVLGGTGFAWENDIHLFLKRAKANEQALGDPVYHRERVLQLLTG
jgi:alkylation response protein AidB-like acyl-CoA dehydrogenase